MSRPVARRLARAAGLALGFAADRRWGDPRRGHPVAGFGRFAMAVEARWWAPSRSRGAAYTALCVGAPTAVALAVSRRGGAVTDLATTAVTTWAVLGGRSLEREAEAMSNLLRADEVPRARRRLRHLVGRITDTLDSGDLARATIESVAENTSDAVVAPLFWGAVAGAPGLVAYRAANTLDAMVGHRTPRLVQFGWASARFDDVLNLIPARLAAASVVALAPLVGGDAQAALRAWRRDASAHPSPNAGPIESSFAGALGLTLGGVTVYASGVEHRPELGDGRAPEVADIERAVVLARWVDRAALAGAALLALRPRFAPASTVFGARSARFGG